MGKNIYIYVSHSHINLDIDTHKIGYHFNKIVTLTKILFQPILYNSIVQVGFT